MTEDLLSERLKKLPNDIRLIVEKRLALLALDLGERLSVASGKLATGFVLALVLGFAFLFLLIAIAMFLGDVLRNPAGGFILVSVFLFVFAFFSWRLLPGMIERSAKNAVISALLKEPPTLEDPPADE